VSQDGSSLVELVELLFNPELAGGWLLSISLGLLVSIFVSFGFDHLGMGELVLAFDDELSRSEHFVSDGIFKGSLGCKWTDPHAIGISLAEAGLMLSLVLGDLVSKADIASADLEVIKSSPAERVPGQMLHSWGLRKDTLFKRAIAMVRESRSRNYTN